MLGILFFCKSHLDLGLGMRGENTRSGIPGIQQHKCADGAVSDLLNEGILLVHYWDLGYRSPW